MQIRKEVRYFLIWLANKVGGVNNYYDFGEPVVGSIVFKDELIVMTDRSMYKLKKDGSFKRISEKVDSLKGENNE